MKVFKTIQGQVVDVVDHTLEVLKKYPVCDIHIGNDSQVVGNKTVYCTVIAYRYGIRGAHYIYCKEIVDKKIKDLWTRLWGETDRTMEVAQWFTAKIKVPVIVEFDFNEDKYHDSHKLISASVGWALSLGYTDVRVKPQELLATKASDHHCRDGKQPRIRKKKNKTGQRASG